MGAAYVLKLLHSLNTELKKERAVFHPFKWLGAVETAKPFRRPRFVTSGKTEPPLLMFDTLHQNAKFIETFDQGRSSMEQAYLVCKLTDRNFYFYSETYG